MGEGSGILSALGGVGLFLLGMVLLTEGLQGLAGPALRHILRQFTRTPARGVAAGTLVTALLQSSSATIVTVIGFVSAELLTFAQGVGVVLGANIGTTITGWLVALIGFRVELDLISPPLVLVGGLMRIFGGRRLSQAGLTLAGFALLFLGIGVMQQGMVGLTGVLTPETMPGANFAGRVELVVIGAAITAVTQSSSAGVAAALVALSTGAIGFEQAALIVVGMNVGTTVTALLATLGGSVAARQTGVAHLLFNLFTGLLAIVLLEFFAPQAETAIRAGGSEEARLSLVLFHTGFNVVGVVLTLALLRPFIALVRRIVPERRETLVARLDTPLLAQPAAAVDAAAATVVEITRHICGLLAARLAVGAPPRGDGQKLREILRAIDRTRAYARAINISTIAGTGAQARHLEVLHVLDHLNRLAYRLNQDERISALAGEHQLARLAHVARSGVIAALAAPDGQEPSREERAAAWFGKFQAIVQTHQRKFRQTMLEGAQRSAAPVEDEVSTPVEIVRMDAVRWLHRVSYHLWRIFLHLDRIDQTRRIPRPPPAIADAREEARTDVRAD